MKKIIEVASRLSRVAKIKNTQKNVEVTDEYQRGLYNGLELALSILKTRQPDFKE